MDLVTLMADLSACLCEELADGPALCFCGVEPGEIVVADSGFGCDDACGMAWVRLGAAYPAVDPGQRDNSGTPCGVFLGADLEIGVLRCMPTEADGSSPTVEELTDVTLLMVSDMQAARRAIMCCTALADVDFQLNSWAPVGPQGGVVGGTWTVSVLI